MNSASAVAFSPFTGGLGAGRAADEFGFGGRLFAVDRDVGDLRFFGLFFFLRRFFAALDRGLALFTGVLFGEAERLQFGAVARVLRRRRLFDHFGDFVFGARATATAGGHRQGGQGEQRKRDEQALDHAGIFSAPGGRPTRTGRDLGALAL